MGIGRYYFLILLLVPILFSISIPSAFSQTVSAPAGSSVPGCEQTNECFIPYEITVDVGATVTWSNDDTAVHTVTSGSAADGPNGIFDSSLFMAGTTFSVTFDQDGTFDYFCMVHPWMMGQIIVGEGGPTPIPPSVNVRTDQSTYQPGEAVEVSGSVRHFDGRTVSLKIVNPFGSLVLVDQVVLSSGGAFKEQYKIAGPQWIKSGSYTVTVQAGFAKAQNDFFLRILYTIPPPSQPTTEFEGAAVIESKTVESIESEPTSGLECGKGTHEEDGKCVVDTRGGGCLIATATYGSELAPQVQQLREIRDNVLLETESGSAFMEQFNQFYYSFSPTIADLERDNPIFKQVVKLAITPLITSLSILNYVDIDSEAEVLGYGISLIFLNLGMYILLPTFAILKLRRIL